MAFYEKCKNCDKIIIDFEENYNQIIYICKKCGYKHIVGEILCKELFQQ